MVDDQKTPKLRLVSRTQQTPVDGSTYCTLPFSGEADVPDLPAMPGALLQLELCLSATPVDLQDATNIIKGDIGLTVQLLRLVISETENPPDEIQAISNVVVQVGIEKLRALAAQTKRLPDRRAGAEGTSAIERFWTHSRLTALLAEELASQSPEVAPDEAYLAGLLCHLGDVPSVLGWLDASSDPADSRHIGYKLAKAWSLPRVLTDVIGGYGEVSRTRESRALLDIAEAADNWALRLEFLVARDAMRSK
jgi:HD-like signal output (HDOD) protein